MKTTVSPTVHWLATVFWKISKIVKKVTITSLQVSTDSQIQYFHAFATTYWAWRIKWPHAHIFYKRNMVLGMPIQTVANYIKGCGFNKFIDRSHNLKKRKKCYEKRCAFSNVVLQLFLVILLRISSWNYKMYMMVNRSFSSTSNFLWCCKKPPLYYNRIICSVDIFNFWLHVTKISNIREIVVYNIIMFCYSLCFC